MSGLPFDPEGSCLRLVQKVKIRIYQWLPRPQQAVHKPFHQCPELSKASNLPPEYKIGARGLIEELHHSVQQRGPTGG